MTLYLLPFHNKALVQDTIDMTSFVFVGKNWDFYFTEKVHPKAEKIENCQIVSQAEKFWDFDQEQNLFLCLDSASSAE